MKQENRGRKEQNDETDRNDGDSNDVYGKGYVYVYALLLHFLLQESGGVIATAGLRACFFCADLHLKNGLAKFRTEIEAKTK